jgi:hypothetical protein
MAGLDLAEPALRQLELLRELGLRPPSRSPQVANLVRDVLALSVELAHIEMPIILSKNRYRAISESR